MMESRFCYCCRVHHPSDQMQRFFTRQGWRWRCMRSIEAARCASDERDAFGRQQSELNRAQTQAQLERRLLRPTELRFQR